VPQETLRENNRAKPRKTIGSSVSSCSERGGGQASSIGSCIQEGAAFRLRSPPSP
jgi:hypothetical protein